MKSTLVNVLLAASVMAGVCACSSDDNGDAPLTVETIPGEYLGKATGTMVTITSEGDSIPSNIIYNGDETAVVTVNSDGTVNVKEPTFYVASENATDGSGKYGYPGATVRNISLTTDGNTLKLVPLTYSSMNGLYSVTGQMEGVFRPGGILSLDFTFLHAGGMVGTVHFEGKKK